MNPVSISSQAPGRINIIGEHTDYNDGFVLPAAIDRTIKFKLELHENLHLCEVKSLDRNQDYAFDLRSYQPVAGGWKNYVMGVVSELQKLGGDIKGFRASFGGNVPIGGGVSSSAALECSLAIGLNEIFSLGFDKWQLIKACQMAEHHFVGMKCGIMDQFASTLGKKDHVMLLDCRSLDYQYFPLDLGEYELLLLNTNVSHALASSEYNTRRSECEEGVALLKSRFPEITSLRDVSITMLLADINLLPQTIYRRCFHVVSENQRVLDATDALKDHDLKKLGELMYASHQSLSQDYAVSCSELDFLSQSTSDKHYVLGSRMMGGGFGGCTINLIKKENRPAFLKEITRSYAHQFGRELTPLPVSTGDGASVI